MHEVQTGVLVSLGAAVVLLAAFLAMVMADVTTLENRLQDMELSLLANQRADLTKMESNCSAQHERPFRFPEHPVQYIDGF